MEPISVLTLARADSLFLAHFVHNYCAMTNNFEDTELLVMASENDTWNQDLFRFYEKHTEYNIKFFFENRHLGMWGRHLFFTELARESRGDWILDTCDDQMFIFEGWDDYLRDFLNCMDSSELHIVIPRFENTGSVDHIISRGYFEAIGSFGGHGSIDSWMNRIIEKIPERVRDTTVTLMHDFTPDGIVPQMRSDDAQGLLLPAWGSEEIENAISAEIRKAKECIMKENSV